MDLPSSKMSPPAGFKSPEIACSTVLLPAPLAPIKATISPSRTVSVAPRTARMLP